MLFVDGVTSASPMLCVGSPLLLSFIRKSFLVDIKGVGISETLGVKWV